MADGAFVEIDQHKLNRRGLYLLGVKEALDRVENDLVRGAQAQANPLIGQALMKVAELYRNRKAEVEVSLTKEGMRSGASAIHTMRKD